MPIIINNANIPFPKRFFPGYTIFQTKDGKWRTRKITLTAARVKKDPAFANSMHHATEFGQAGKAGKLVRMAFNRFKGVKDKVKLGGLLVKSILNATREDEVSPLGKRALVTGKPELLEGFQFNTGYALHELFNACIKVKPNLAKNLVTVEIPSFIPRECLMLPVGITHFKITATCGAIHVEKNSSATDTKSTEYIAFGSRSVPVTRLTLKLSAVKGCVNFIAVGIELYEMEKKRALPVGDGQFNPLEIVKVIKVLPNTTT